MVRSQRICRIVTGVLRRLPERIRANGAALMLNHLFAHVFADNAVAFLDGKVIELHVVDLGAFIQLRMNNGMLFNATGELNADLYISGDTLGLLQLATQRVRAEELFARGQLSFSGGQELVASATTFVDGLSACILPGPARRAMERIADRYENGCGLVHSALAAQ